MRDSDFTGWLNYEYSHLNPAPELVETIKAPCGEIYRMVQFYEPVEVCLFVEVQDDSGLDNNTHVLAVGWSDGAFGNGAYGGLEGESSFERMRTFAKTTGPY